MRSCTTADDIFQAHARSSLGTGSPCFVSSASNDVFPYVAVREYNMSDSSYFLLAFGEHDMARRPLTNPRKHASQERARATVDALIEATARILVREGFDRASTNRIAEEAGVSVGSLYQYYPCKEALVAAVIDRHNQEIMQVVRRGLADVDSQPTAKAVGA